MKAIRVLSAFLLLTLPAAAQVPDTLKHSIPAPPVGAQSGANLGFSVAIDGVYTVVGAPLDDFSGNESGVVKVFDSATGALVLILPNPGSTGSEFGYSVAISGTLVAVGAWQDDTGANNTGRAYVYDLSSGTPTVPVVTLNNPNPGTDDRFGCSIAISGTRVVIGAAFDDAGASNAGSAYVYDLSSGTPTAPIATLNNPSPAANDYFGISVGISGARVVVGARYDDTGAVNAGSAYVYDVTGTNPTVPAFTLNNPSPTANDYFGYSVAISGTRVVVGAYLDDAGGGFDFDSGSAYIFDLASATPTVPVTTLSNPSPGQSDQFGIAVAISGSRVVVGAFWDNTGASLAGSAYVYDVAGSTPTVPIATLNNPTPAASDVFGSAVAVSGSQVVVGAPLDNTGATDAGSAYLYDFSSGTPTVPTAILNSPTPLAGDIFGSSMAVSGNLMVVGAPYEDTGANDAGSAYVYDLSSGTPTVPVATLNNPSPASDDRFGYSVAISGMRVVVGAFWDDTGAENAGGVYVYDLSSGTPTIPVATLNNPSPTSYGNFGQAVAISGTLVVIGSTGDDTGAINAGTAYVYDLSSGTPTVPVATLNNPGPAANDEFGNAVAISGIKVVVGASHDDTGAPEAGTAYVYDLSSGTPTAPLATLTNPSPVADDSFGFSVAISGTSVVVGVHYDDTGAENAGSVYVYNLSSGTPTVPVATLNNPSPTASDDFGNSVAIDGILVVVGARYDNTGESGVGSAYVYDLGSGTPTAPVATLNNPSPALHDNFGSSVAISGTTVAIGTPNDDTVSQNKGSAYVFGPAPFPEIAVEHPSGTGLSDGADSIPFGIVNVGSSSAAKTFIVNNIGSLALNITGVNVTGGDAGDFLVNTGGMVGNLPAGQSTSFSVTFAPGAAGNRSTALQILNTDSDEGIFDISLTGVAISPEIEVRQPSFSIIADGGIKNFGAVAVNDNTSLVFTIKNTGNADLTGLGITFDGTDPGAFSVTAPPVAPVPGPLGSTTFTVQFAPTSAGPKTAAMHIANNDTDENPYDITLLGNVSAQELWRQTHFGSILNTGDGADLNDYESDGLVNLIEFAFGLNPKQSSAGQLPQGQIIGPNYVLFFNQPAGVSGITYGAEWSTTLQPGSWTPISDTGIPPQHVFSVPIGPNTRMFTRLKVTSP